MNSSAAPSRRIVCLTIDAEPDCPPYLWSWLGMEAGMPAILALLADEGVPATFFTTGDAAHRYPELIARIVRSGHELANHGWSHRAFTDLSMVDADVEIRRTSALLRTFAPVSAFRAPYLSMPDDYVRLLEADSIVVDASIGRYKPNAWRRPQPSALYRLKASITPSWLRLPGWIRDPVLRRLASPTVLFVHPWEFVDLRRAPIPWDCRAGTGARALESLREVILLFKREGAVFVRVSDTTGREVVHS